MLQMANERTLEKTKGRTVKGMSRKLECSGFAI
jgi:hypothetical protein